MGRPIGCVDIVEVPALLQEMRFEDHLRVMWRHEHRQVREEDAMVADHGHVVDTLGRSVRVMMIHERLLLKNR